MLPTFKKSVPSAEKPEEELQKHQPKHQRCTSVSPKMNYTMELPTEIETIEWDNFGAIVKLKDGGILRYLGVGKCVVDNRPPGESHQEFVAKHLHGKFPVGRDEQFSTNLSVTKK